MNTMNANRDDTNKTAKIYILSKKSTGEVCYLGRTEYDWETYQQHLRAASPNSTFGRWVREMQASGDEIECVVLERSTPLRALARERSWRHRLEQTGHVLLPTDPAVRRAMELRKLTTRLPIREIADLKEAARQDGMNTSQANREAISVWLSWRRSRRGPRRPPEAGGDRGPTERRAPEGD
jgi:hypothetical protein